MTSRIRQYLRWLRTMFLPQLPAGKDAWLLGVANSINLTTEG